MLKCELKTENTKEIVSDNLNKAIEKYNAVIKPKIRESRPDPEFMTTSGLNKYRMYRVIDTIILNAGFGHIEDNTLHGGFYQITLGNTIADESQVKRLVESKYNTTGYKMYKDIDAHYSIMKLQQFYDAFKD